MSIKINGNLIKFEENVMIYDQTDETVITFEKQWQKFAYCQYDSVSGLNVSKNRLERFINLENDLVGKNVLEVGSGSGRFTEIIAQHSCYLFTLDLSKAIFLNSNKNKNKNIKFYQMDINNLRFEENQFDFVICIGVIQHTKNPDLTILNLWSMVKPGGYLIIDQYRFNLSSVLSLEFFYRLFFKFINPHNTIKYSELLVKFLLPIHKKFAGNNFLSKLLNRFSPVTSFFKTLPDLRLDQQLDWAILSTHDKLADYYKKRTYKSKFLKLINKMDSDAVSLFLTPYTIEAKVRKSHTKNSDKKIEILKVKSNFV